MKPGYLFETGLMSFEREDLKNHLDGNKSYESST